MTFGLDDYSLRLLGIFLLMLPAAFYAMGLIEGRWGRYLFTAGIGFHLLSIIHRACLLERLPLTSKHDNLSLLAFASALIYLYFYWRRGAKDYALIAIPLIVGLMLVALGHRPVNTISPFMNSPWFYLHIFFYFLSYGFMGISACLGIFYLLKDRPDYEHYQYLGLINGWIMLSLSLLFGSVWFYMAYGTYWLWTSKELWITLTWLLVGLYLHARLMRSLRGRPASILGIISYLAAMFTYFGVGTIIKSPPTQF